MDGHHGAGAVPVGESDRFAKIGLLRRAIDERLPAATGVTYLRISHSLKPVLEDVLDQAADFVMGLVGQGSGC